MSIHNILEATTMTRFKRLPAIIAIAALTGCAENPPQSLDNLAGGSVPLPADSPQELLLAALDEVQAISEAAVSPGSSVTGPALRLLKGSADTIIVYGQQTADGYGAVVSERRSYPRGILLITVRRTFGRENNVTVSELRRYTTQAALASDEPEQTVLTEVFGLSRDTIVTRVTRNGRVETYTFRLPVVTVTLNADPSQSRRITRSALGGEIVIETEDGNGQLLSRRRHSTLPDGSVIALTEYPDGSWRRTRTLGRADGTILRETVTSE